MRADRPDLLGRRARLLALGLALASALAPVADCRGGACIRHSDCDPGLVCSPLGSCVTSIEPDGGELGDAADGAVDGAVDGADAADGAAADAASDAPTDAAIDAVPPPLQPPYMDPGPSTMSPSTTTQSSTGSRR